MSIIQTLPNDKLLNYFLKVSFSILITLPLAALLAQVDPYFLQAV